MIFIQLVRKNNILTRGQIMNNIVVNTKEIKARDLVLELNAVLVESKMGDCLFKTTDEFLALFDAVKYQGLFPITKNIALSSCEESADERYFLVRLYKQDGIQTDWQGDIK